MTYALTYDRVVCWDAELTALTTRIADPLSTRPEPRQAFTDLARALLADATAAVEQQSGRMVHAGA